MNDTIAALFSAFIYFLIVCIVIRALLTWFPIDPRNDFVQLLDRVTRPLLEPVRRVVPPLGGMIDISAIIVIVILSLMLTVVDRAANS